MPNTFVNNNPAGNSGYAKYGENTLSAIRKVILTPKGYTMTNLAAAVQSSTWIAATKATKALRIYPLPLAVDVKPASEADVYESRKLAGKKFIRTGKEGMMLTLDINPLVAAKLGKSINFKNWDVFFGDENGNILGTTPDGILFKALSCTDVHLGKMEFSDGSKARTNELSIVLTDPAEWNYSPALISQNLLTAGFNINTLDGVYDVNIAVSGATTAGFTASVNIDGFALTDPDGQRPGLAKADFVFAKAGVPVSLSGATMTDNGDGTYGFAITQTSGNFTLTLVPCASISVTDYAIEPLAVATFTI